MATIWLSLLQSKVTKGSCTPKSILIYYKKNPRWLWNDGQNNMYMHLLFSLELHVSCRSLIKKNTHKPTNKQKNPQQQQVCLETCQNLSFSLLSSILKKSLSHSEHLLRERMHLKVCILQYLQGWGKDVSMDPDNYNTKNTHWYFSDGRTKSTCSKKMTNRPRKKNASLSYTD